MGYGSYHILVPPYCECYCSRPHLLKEPFRTELTKGARGVVFFSLGSAVRTQWLPPEFMRNVLRAVAQLPEWHFIVKVAEEDELSRELAKGIPNIHLTTWAPQPAILGILNKHSRAYKDTGGGSMSSTR